MRMLLVGAVVCMAGCSLIATTVPDPGPWRERPTRPECRDSYGPPVGDTFIAAGAGVVALAGVGLMLPDQPGSTVHSSPPVLGAAVLAGGILAAAFETTAASIGYRRVTLCKEAGTEWDMGTFDRLEVRRRAIATEAGRLLRCKPGDLTIEGVDLDATDPLRQQWRQENIAEAIGCNLAAWCWYVGERITCAYPPDFGMVAAQLKVETQCSGPVPQMRQVFERRRWLAARRETVMQISWRLEACGHAYSCIVTGGVAPVVACKAALVDGP